MNGTDAATGDSRALHSRAATLAAAGGDIFEKLVEAHFRVN
jgi:hypothetical protein